MAACLPQLSKSRRCRTKRIPLSSIVVKKEEAEETKTSTPAAFTSSSSSSLLITITGGCATCGAVESLHPPDACETWKVNMCKFWHNHLMDPKEADCLHAGDTSKCPFAHGDPDFRIPTKPLCARVIHGVSFGCGGSHSIVDCQMVHCTLCRCSHVSENHIQPIVYVWMPVAVHVDSLRT